MKKIIRSLFLILILLTLGCAKKFVPSDSVFINKDFDFSIIKRVAVLPFENLTEDRNAGDIIRYMVFNEIQKFIETVPLGDVEKFLRQKNIQKINELTKEDLTSLAHTLKVDALVTGHVYKYGESRTGTINLPEVAFSLVIIEPEEGSIIFGVTKSGRSDSFLAKHFGVGINTVNQLALKLVKEAVDELSKL